MFFFLVQIANVNAPGWKSLERFTASETNDLGFDVIVDLTTSLPCAMWKPKKFEVINSLAPFGHWVSTEHNLEINPLESEVLLKKSASVSFSNIDTWLHSGYRQGLLLRK